MTATAPATPEAARTEAMEIFLSQLVFVLEGESRSGFTADKLARWLDTCTRRMSETGSAPSEVVTQLRALQARVLA